jgi:hypothetical protein
MRGAYLSPVGEDETREELKKTWTFRAQWSTWELLTASGLDSAGFLTLKSQAPWGPWLMAGPDNRCRQALRESNAPRWRIRLMHVPGINISPLIAHRSLVLRLEDPEGLPPEVVTLIRLIGNVHQEIGLFYVLCHGTASDVIQLVQQAVGPVPYRDDLGVTEQQRDRSAKESFLLVQQDERHPHSRRIGPHPSFPTTPVGQEHLVDTLERGFEASRDLAELILHALAHAQHLQQGHAPTWRVRLYLAPKLEMRALVYHPGPVGSPDSPVVTTLPHTDATWLTLLSTDATGGLEIKREDAWLPVTPLPGGILVNSGKVLAEATKSSEGGSSFYKAVCHRVIRVSESDTRISVPFFYNEHGSETGGCDP